MKKALGYALGIVLSALCVPCALAWYGCFFALSEGSDPDAVFPEDTF